MHILLLFIQVTVKGQDSYVISVTLASNYRVATVYGLASAICGFSRTSMPNLRVYNADAAVYVWQRTFQKYF